MNASIAMLVVASVFWGMGFTATVWSLNALTPASLVFYRFGGAFVLGFVFLMLGLLFKKTSREKLKYGLRFSFWPGVFLFLTLIFQTWGLKTTTPTKSAFITTLYVILVPLISPLIFKENLHRKYWIYVFLALIGTVFIAQVESLFMGQIPSIVIGDFLTLICALAATFHIFAVGFASKKYAHAFTLNTFQCLWVALFSAVFFLFEPSGWNLSAMDSLGWTGLWWLTLGSSLIAFFLQMKSQEKLPPSLASILFLLESPFSFLFSFWLLQEQVTTAQICGGVLILISAWGAVQNPSSSTVALETSR